MSSTANLETLRLEESEHGIGRIVLDRPDRMNAINATMLQELVDAIEIFEKEDVRVIVLSGSGDRAFSVGADIKEKRESEGTDPLLQVEHSRRGQAAVARLEQSRLPIVASIEGYCLGGGMELAMVADIRIAGESATFGLPEHAIGLLPGWGGACRLQHLIGEVYARELLFTARQYDASEMADYGFVNDVVSDNTVSEHTLDLAKNIASNAPVAQRYTKRILIQSRTDVQSAFELSAQANGLLVATDDYSEGVSAFAEDREPEFEGS